MKRTDWVARLWETLEARRQLPFEWAGRHESQDCCTFVAACLDAMTDGNYLDELLTHYSDEASALAYIEANGGLEATLSKHLGEPKRVSFMGMGDVALVSVGGRELAGICVRDCIVVAGENGIGRLPRKTALRCWSA